MTTPTAQTGTIQVADGIFAFVPPADGSLGGTNGGFIVGDEGVVVIEGLMTKKTAQHVLSEVKRVTSKPIRFLIYTHFHGDHTYAGGVFLPAAVVGHKECREELFEKWDPWVERFATSRPESAAEFRALKPVPPDIIFNEKLTIHLGNKRLELHYFGRAHTRGDVFIHSAQDRVVFSGDAVVNARVPAFMDGYPASWINVLDQAQTLDFATLVPGHGPVGNKQTAADLQTFIRELQSQVRQAYDAKKSEADAAAGVKLPRYASWPGIQNLAMPVQRMYLEWKAQL
ncbi:MAG: MBL fold metallo-hydrolase [SAR202 cluster bacterium]|nr:MBL fold metallo-hydrolase [SAR202 cluster bacterium]